MGVSACQVVVTANDVKETKPKWVPQYPQTVIRKAPLDYTKKPHPEHEFMAKWESFSLGSSMSS